MTLETLNAIPDGEERLLVDLSFRTEPSVDDIVIADAIRTYRPAATFDPK